MPETITNWNDYLKYLIQSDHAIANHIIATANTHAKTLLQNTNQTLSHQKVGQLVRQHAEQMRQSTIQQIQTLHAILSNQQNMQWDESLAQLGSDDDLRFNHIAFLREAINHHHTNLTIDAYLNFCHLPKSLQQFMSGDDFIYRIAQIIETSFLTIIKDDKHAQSNY